MQVAIQSAKTRLWEHAISEKLRRLDVAPNFDKLKVPKPTQSATRCIPSPT